jgi:hypothetical protein
MSLFKIKRQIKMKLYATMTKPTPATKPALQMPKDSILCSAVNPGDEAPHCIVLHPATSANVVVVHLWNCQVGYYTCGDYYQRSEFKAAVEAYEVRCKACGLDAYPPTAPATRNIS